MRHLALLAAIWLAGIATAAAPDATQSNDPVARIAENVIDAVQAAHPDAHIERLDNGTLIAKHGTATFTVHRALRTGEILERTTQVEGPNYKGFLLSIDYRPGAYDGPAMVPQTLREPYWQTFIDRPMTLDGKGHYVINLSYGSRIDPEFLSALHEALPTSRPPETAER